jgi:acyl carrier protein
MNSDQSSSDSVSAALIEILRDDLNIDVSRVTRESRLVDDVGLDSVAFAVGMVAIEDKLGVAVSEQELLGCDTVGALGQRSRSASERAGHRPVQGDARLSSRPGGLRQRR